MQASPIGTMAGPLRRRIGAALGSPVSGESVGCLATLKFKATKIALELGGKKKVLPFFFV